MHNGETENYLEEIEGNLLMIRKLVLVCGQQPEYSDEAETILRFAQATKLIAAGRLEDISRFAEQLEFGVSSIIADRRPVAAAESRILLDKVAQIEALLAKMHLRSEDLPIDIDDLLEVSFDNLRAEHPKPAAAEAPPAGPSPESVPEPEAPAAEGFEGFEIDEEMLEIFAMEAEDLMRNIQSNLEILESRPNDRDALLEIRRNAHTLKGSAGIVGLKPLSQLAHRVEDLLDFLSENEIEGNEKILELLRASTDCLSALGAGENSAQLSARINGLYREFDAVLHSLKLEDEWEQSLEPDPAPAAEPIPVPAPPEPAIARSAAAAEQPAPDQQQKSVIRVSLEKLDELVRLVGDLVISRSVFERRLGEFERQIGELRLSTERLKRSTGKLETDFEASLLEGSGFGIAPAYRDARQFDSLEFDRYTEFHQTTRELLETSGDAVSINSELENIRGNLELLYSGQSRLIENLQDRLLRLRMVRFDSLAARLQRTVRMTCDEERKQADLFIEGSETEVDTQILDSLVEPLLHLLRNAVAHGIEPPDTRRLLGKPERGRIHLRIRSEGTHIILTVSDDGRGISVAGVREKAVRGGFVSEEEVAAMTPDEIFNLCFLPGFSTAERVSQTAGRGVGMNIIRTNIQRQQGTISIDSEPQKGTTINIRLPMALAVTRGLLVRSGGNIFALPMKLVRKMTEVASDGIDFGRAGASISLDGTECAVAPLCALLGIRPSDTKREALPALVLDTHGEQRVLVVEQVLRAEEIVIKPFGTPLHGFPYLLGASILGDGSVVPVLDVLYLLKNHVPAPTILGGSDDEPVEAPVLHPEVPTSAEPAAMRVLIVDDSPSVRHIMSKLIRNAGWEAVLAKDGLEALDILHDGKEFPAVVLTDVEMPRMNGYDLLASIKNDEKLRDLPVIMITSRASDKHEKQAFELGVSSYLTKPFDDSFLIEEIRSLSSVVC